MHIGIVAPYDPWPERHDSRQAFVGGVERSIGATARTLAQHGHDIHLVCSADDSGADEPFPGVHRIRVPRRGTICRVPLAPLWQRLPEGLDTVQVAASYPFVTDGTLAFARRQGLPCVIDFHFEPRPEGAFPALLARHYRVLARNSYGLADRVMARSLAYANEATILDDVPPDRLRVVPNGFDDHIFTPGPQRSTPDQILVVGRLVPYKGIRVLLDALSQIKDAPPLMVAGDGPLRRTLQDKASDLRVDARFLGHVSDQQLADLYRTSCFTVLPSVNRQEAFGMSLIESMGCGTPVIASDLPGVAQVARQGGLVARPDDAADLAEKIAMMLDDPTRVPRGAPLANAIHATYAQASIARQVAAVHAELVGRNTVLSSAEEGDTACAS